MPGWVGKRTTGQTLGDQGTESLRNLSTWGGGCEGSESTVSLVRAGHITKDHKLAGLPEVTPVRVTGGARLFYWVRRGTSTQERKEVMALEGPSPSALGVEAGSGEPTDLYIAAQ